MSVNRLSYRVLALWAAMVLICLVIYSRTTQSPADEPAGIVSPVDALVFIAASDMAADPVVEFSIASTRKGGRWKGPIFVLTDHVECFSNAVEELNVQVVPIPQQPDLMHIKSLKTRLFDYLPTTITTVLYIDADVIVAQPLGPFLQDLGEQIKTVHQHSSKGVSFGMFLDAQGHMLRICSGCDKWHTGVIYLDRGTSDKCMQAWRDVLLTTREFDTDQAAIDHVEHKKNTCNNAISLPTRHLLFAKDYVAWALSPYRTFVHVTAAGRLDSQDYFYRSFVVPSILKATDIDMLQLGNKKECLVPKSV